MPYMSLVNKILNAEISVIKIQVTAGDLKVDLEYLETNGHWVEIGTNIDYPEFRIIEVYHPDALIYRLENLNCSRDYTNFRIIKAY